MRPMQDATSFRQVEQNELLQASAQPAPTQIEMANVRERVEQD